MGDFKATFSSRTGTQFGSNFNTAKARTGTSGLPPAAVYHKNLLGRSENDQHPISAISGLSAALSIVPTQALTNIEIQAIITEG